MMSLEEMGDQSIEGPARDIVSRGVLGPKRFQGDEDPGLVHTRGPACVGDRPAAAATEVDAELLEPGGGPEVGGDHITDPGILQ
jgi:hypothetical protein